MIKSFSMIHFWSYNLVNLYSNSTSLSLFIALTYKKTMFWKAKRMLLLNNSTFYQVMWRYSNGQNTVTKTISGLSNSKNNLFYWTPYFRKIHTLFAIFLRYFFLFIEQDFKEIPQNLTYFTNLISTKRFQCYFRIFWT